MINKLCSYKIKVYDPIIKSLNNFSDLEMVKSLKNAVSDVQVIFIMLPYNEFNELNSIEFKKLIKNKYIIDPYRVINEGQVDKKALPLKVK